MGMATSAHSGSGWLPAASEPADDLGSLVVQAAWGKGSPVSAEKLAFRLLDLARSMGVERGTDVVLGALYGRWRTHSRDERHPAALLPTLDPLVGVADSEAYRRPLEAIVTAVAEIRPEEVVGTFEAVLERLTEGGGKRGGEFNTPASIARLLAALTVRRGVVAYDPACGSGSTLLAAHHAAEGVKLVGTDVDERAVNRTVMRLQLHGLLPRISKDDAFAATTSGFADVVLAQPPWGMRFEPQPRERKGDMPWLFLALDALRPGGRAAVVMSQNSLWSRYAEAQASLFSRDAVEAIITLPGGMFQNTGIPTAIWLLRRDGPTVEPGRVLLIDAETLVRAAGRISLELPPEAIEQVAEMVWRFRKSGTVDAPGHVARVLSHAELDSVRGLVPQAYLEEPPEEAVTHPTPDRSLLTEIRLTNFKSFGADARIPLAPLTLVFGANSAGKSSVLQSLLLLKQSIGAHGLVTQGPVTDVGGFSGVVHRHVDERVELGFTYGVVPSWIPAGGTVDPARLRAVHWTFGDDGGRGALRSTEFRFGDLGLMLRLSDSQTDDRLNAGLDDVAEILKAIAEGGVLYPFETKYFDRRADAESVVRQLRMRNVDELALRADGLLPSTEPLLDWSAVAGLDDGARTRLQSYTGSLARLAGGVATEIRQLLESVVWLGPLRSAPRRFYDRSSHGAAAGDGRHIALFLLDHATAVDQVNDWLERMEVPYSLKVLPLGTGSGVNVVGDLVAIVLTDRRSKVDVTPADVGFGVSQILPVIVESLSQRESIILVEQPETHLHPRLQARLADLFIEATRSGGLGNQMLVETHSEHLILRIQRRIREGQIDAAHVSVVYVDQDEQGRTTVRRLRLDDKGDFLDEWPHGFFDERLDELFGGF
jgi:predicted RNA methylase